MYMEWEKMLEIELKINMASIRIKTVKEPWKRGQPLRSWLWVRVVLGTSPNHVPWSSGWFYEDSVMSTITFEQRGLGKALCWRPNRKKVTDGDLAPTRSECSQKKLGEQHCLKPISGENSELITSWVQLCSQRWLLSGLSTSTLRSGINL